MEIEEGSRTDLQISQLGNMSYPRWYDSRHLIVGEVPTPNKTNGQKKLMIGRR